MGRQDTFIVKIILLQEKNTRQTVLAKPRLHRHYANLFIWQITSKGQWTGQFLFLFVDFVYLSRYTQFYSDLSHVATTSQPLLWYIANQASTLSPWNITVFIWSTIGFFMVWYFFAHPIKGKCSSQSFCLDCNRYQVQNFKKMANEAGFTSHTQN